MLGIHMYEWYGIDGKGFFSFFFFFNIPEVDSFSDTGSLFGDMD